MTVAQLKCPNCGAALEANAAPVTRCEFCQASLIVGSAGAGDRTMTYEAHVVTLVMAGPSNRPKLAELLVARAAHSPDQARALVSDTPCEVVVWKDREQACDLRGALEAAGAVAQLSTRNVTIVLPPLRGVTLADAGRKKIMVIKVVREYLALGLREAKELVDSAPSLLIREMDGPRAEAFVQALCAAGASAHLE